MPSLDSIIEEFYLLGDNKDEDTVTDGDNKDEEIVTDSSYNLVFDYYTSSAVINDYEQAVQQLDQTSIAKNYQWLLFNAFSIVTNTDFYTYERRDKLCNFWLPIYQSMFKQLLSKETSATQMEHTDHLPLNVIKYLIANMIQMQETSECMGHFMKLGTQFQNLTQKEEYFQIIKMVLPLLIDPDINERLGNDDHTKVKLELQPNDLLNTLNVTPTFILWIMFKLIIMFIKTDGDCLTMMKHDENVKNILFQSLKLIKDNNPVRFLLYVSLALLLNEENIKNEINDPKEIITALTTNITQILESDDDDDDGWEVNGVDGIDLLIALKAFLQHDQVKNDFIQNNGVQLLIEYFLDSSESSATDLLNSDDVIAELKSESKLKPEEEIEVAKKFLTEFTENGSDDIPDLIKEGRNYISDVIKEGRILALECLFTMSFNKEAVEILKKNEEFISEMRKVDAENGTTAATNERLKKAVDGLLWKLEKEDEFKKQEQQTITTKQKDEFDLMISYSWSDKPLVHDIYKYLTENSKYRIWLDENEMAGSLCEAMARAVEKSKFILMCMSETYKGSDNCRNEAEYARDRKKKIIPLIMKQVERDGWLGFISAGKMYIDFTRQDFQKAIKLLIAEIERNYREKRDNIQVATSKEQGSTADSSIPQRIPTSLPSIAKLPVRPSVISNTYKQISIESWSEQDVQNFLYDNKLDVMILLTEYMNGEELDQLFRICQVEQDRWIMFDRLSKELENRYQQILPIAVYLRFLNQTQKYTNVSVF